MFNSVVWSIVVSVIAFSVTVDGSVNTECLRFQIKKHTIINTQESQRNGARYLGSGTVGKSRGCYEMCCGKKNCDVVILKYDDTRVTCFMFECGSPSKCSFQTHSSYKKYAILQFEDQDVNNSIYLSKATKNGYKDAQKDKPRTQNIQTTTTTTTIQPLSDHQKNEEHNWQSETRKATKGAKNWYDVVTTASTHHVVASYHHTKSSNRKDWMGKNVEKTSSKYGSGWKNTFIKTQDSLTQKVDVTTKAPAIKWHVPDAKKTNYQGYDGSKYTFDRGHELPSLQKESNKTPDKDSEEEDFPRRVFVDNNPNYPEEPYGRTNKPRSTTEPTIPGKLITSPNTKAPSGEDRDGGHNRQSITKSTKKPRTTPSYRNIIRVNIRENKLVIPLAVGLVLALLLLMAVVFRLRTSRRRRTKAFLTDDADYLINGMYL